MGFGLTVSESVRRFDDGHLLAGGVPFRVMRLSDAGVSALEQLQDGRAASPAARELGARLVDGGLASVRPPEPAAAPDVTVVIPVHDRSAELERCLRSLGGIDVVVVDDGSAQPERARAICRRHGATLIHRARRGGPAVARNAALRETEAELIAFLDSDCVAPPGWLAHLAGHFTDPRVGAVAPRISPAPNGGHGARERYGSARSPLDLGPVPGAVAPGRPIAWVPAAALLVRRAALGNGFDEALRYGEDVDLVWRLCGAGWTVHYDPTVAVAHHEPSSWRSLLARRYRYGTSAAPLARRHPGRVSPTVARGRPAVATALALTGRPGAACAVALSDACAAAVTLRRTGLPTAAAPGLGLSTTVNSLLHLSDTATRLAAPALIAALGNRRTRPAAAILLTAAPAAQWLRIRPRLDPVRWTAAALADDVAYGAGVWRGCIRCRTAEPLRPRFARAVRSI